MTTPPSVLPIRSPRDPGKRLQECAQRLRERVSRLREEGDARSSAAAWLLDNHAFLQFQIRETRRNLPPSYIRKLPKGKGEFAREPRIYRLAADYAAHATNTIDGEAIALYAETLRQNHFLKLSELWAFGAMLKLALLERLCSRFGEEQIVILCIRSLRSLENVSWRDFVESASVVESILRRDAAGIYPKMDFPTRDQYRHELERMARQAGRSEEELAETARRWAAQPLLRENPDRRATHVGYYLAGPGAREFCKSIGCWHSLSYWLRSLVDRFPSLFYVGGITLLTALLMAGFLWAAGPSPRWLFALLLVPASQTALEIVNALVSRVRPPRVLPSMDFAAGIPDDCKTMVVVPTLLLSADNAARLLEDLEIRYLANRGPNLYFALLTDYSDADQPQTENDAVLETCIEGIRRLNARYSGGLPGPFYLFHRPRRWNNRDRRWMGYERKRGKLNEFNKLLLGRGNWFETIVGDMSVLLEIRYVITLDTDTQLPRDAAAKMVAAIAHPLNRPLIDPKTNTVREGYALIQPRVAVSMESAGRSRLAQIFSGQTGFDPYTTAVSDVYQDLYGRASFTGKGIYDVSAFQAVVGDRFPENTILSHDLIEGEYVRTGLLTSVEVIDDYPASYRAFSKRKHRWVRGDWQIVQWLFPRVPGPAGGKVANPLTFLSRWKIFDNLRRSVFEISLLLLFAAGWLSVSHTMRWTLCVLALLLLPAYCDMFLTILKTPERRFWPSFLQSIGERFWKSHRDVLLNLIFVPHQACLMADAIVRTLARFVTERNRLEWETMAQSEASGGAKIGMLERYSYASSAFWLLFLLGWGHANAVTALLCELWVMAPLISAWLDGPPPSPRDLSERDRVFLRDVALRTWRYFADHSTHQDHALVPDNIQEDPPLTAHRISPTNLGLLLTANLAAHDFGYWNLSELSRSLRRILSTMREMSRERGHFFNWYDTQTLAPLAPRYISSVDSGNLAVSLCAVGQGCTLLLRQPVFDRKILAGLRDHVLRLRDELPYATRTLTGMRLMANLLRQLDCQPNNLFYWEAVLTDAREAIDRLHDTLAGVQDRLRRQHDYARANELLYWEVLLSERMDAALAELYALAPWLTPSLEPELRVNTTDSRLSRLFEELNAVPVLADLPDAYERIRERVIERLRKPEALYPALRATLEILLQRLPDARAYALDLIHRVERTAGEARQFFEDMDFRFLYDEHRKLLRIGYDAEARKPDDSYYDLLASEARSTVFLAIAKGHIPREAWFRLGRKLTGYRNERTLISWSGTMFEYLMPLLHLRNYPNTLLDRGARGAVRIQQIYGRESHVPWGISEAAYAARDKELQYQYRAFGIPALSSRPDRPENLVVAPYATMLALMVDPARATANLRLLAASGCLQRYGFYESLDYSAGALHAPEVVRCFMAHHQGMGLLAIDNALLSGLMQERFHQDPLVQATEFLLQERMPVLVEVLEEEEAPAPAPPSVPPAASPQAPSGLAAGAHAD